CNLIWMCLTRPCTTKRHEGRFPEIAVALQRSRAQTLCRAAFAGHGGVDASAQPQRRGLIYVLHICKYPQFQYRSSAPRLVYRTECNIWALHTRAHRSSAPAHEILRPGGPMAKVIVGTTM